MRRRSLSCDVSNDDTSLRLVCSALRSSSMSAPSKSIDIERAKINKLYCKKAQILCLSGEAIGPTTTTPSADTFPTLVRIAAAQIPRDRPIDGIGDGEVSARGDWHWTRKCSSIADVRVSF
jgi:hypothetical protein